jgi:pimeloyl-ACP methyl ester carboxylesterase
MTPRSWESFRSYYETRGFKVLAPAWPRMTGEVESLRRDSSALAGLGLGEIVDHYAGIIQGLPRPPILIGHSVGGLVVQLLLDRGLGRAGVAIDSATPRGVLPLPWSALRSGWPVLGNPLNYWRTVALTFEQFRYAFANVMAESEARAAYERYAVPGPGRPLFQIASGNFNPWAANRIAFRKNERAPLLLIGGSEDHVVPARLNRINFRLYRHSAALTGYKEFPHRCHLIIGQTGWREVAEFALTWLQESTPRPHRSLPSIPANLTTP